jgi:hypothetical protein
MTPNLSQVNSKLAAKGKRTHQNVGPLKGIAELKRATVKLEKQAEALEREVNELRDSKKLVVPAKKTQASKKATSEVDVTTLVVPRNRKGLVK